MSYMGTFLDMDYSPGVPIMPTHTNYPGSWTWQAAYDEPVGNPNAYYIGPYYQSTWGMYGLGQLSEERKLSQEAAVEAVEQMAQETEGALPAIRQTFTGLVSSLREGLVSEPFDAWGGVFGIGEHDSSRELIQRVNNAHSLFIYKNPVAGQVSIAPGVIDPETGAPGEMYPWWEGAKALPSEIAARAEELAPTFKVGLGVAALVGVYLLASR